MEIKLVFDDFERKHKLQISITGISKIKNMMKRIQKKKH